VFNSPLITVAIGVVRTGDTVLLTQRRKNADCPNRWEFPGGKVHADETVHAGLNRELYEEIGIVVKRYSPLIQFGHQYSHGFVRGYVYLIDDYTGSPQPVEGQAMQWVNRHDVHQFKMLDANHIICQKIFSESQNNLY
tara:strand:+ start:1398 stop:1811 length:414 start_codon:yes stop_codon:yes gene_type:complete